MTPLQIAILFSLSGTAITFLASFLMWKRYPVAFFPSWCWAYGCGIAISLLENQSVPLGRPFLLTQAEMLFAGASTWFLFQTAKRMHGKNLPLWSLALFALGFPLFCSLLLISGVPFEWAVLPLILAMCGSMIGVGIAVLRRSEAYSPIGSRLLGYLVIARGLWALAFPAMQGTHWLWLGFWINGLLEIMVGIGMIVLLAEEMHATSKASAQRIEQLQRDQIKHLAELDRLKSEFIGTVSHELRTPLTSILGFAELLKDNPEQPLNPTQENYASQIEAAAGRLHGIVDDLLDFALLDAGHLALTLEERDLREVIRHEIAILEPQAQMAGIQFSCRLPDIPLLLAMDSRRVGQVLMNLLTNAIKFTPQGGHVAVEAVNQGHQVTVRVSDTGIGIPDHHLTRLFDKFYQVDSGNTRPHSGSGLGLAIARSLIRAHGGQIGVASEPGQGSTFWFTLPTAQASVATGLLY